DAAVFGRARRRQERRAAFAQRNGGALVIEERDKLAISPDAALIERRVGETACAPKLLQLVGGLRGRAGHRFHTPARARGIIEDFGDGIARAAPLLETSKFRRHEASIIEGMLAVHLENGAVTMHNVARPARPEGFALLRLIIGGICNTDLELQRGYYGFAGT